MINFIYSKRYLSSRKKFLKNNLRRLKDLGNALRLFSMNPTHPSLYIEKLKGSKIWTIRIDESNRLFFVWFDENTALLIDIGKHDKYRKY